MSSIHGERNPAPQPPQPKPQSKKLPTNIFTGGIDLNPQDKPTVDTYKPRQDPVANRETLRRQNLLRAAGYRIVVDGVWGPRSQTAWNQYMQKQGKSVVFSATAAANKKPLKLGDPSVHSQNNIDVAQIKRDKAIAKQEAIKQAFSDDVKLRAKIMGDAASLKTDPRRAKHMKLHEIGMVLNDPEAGLDITTKAGARIYQEWAIGHGERLKVTGEYDQATHDNVRAVMAREQKKLAAARLYTIKRMIYRPLGYKGGETPDWYGFGPIPTPQQLDKMLQDGGFTNKLAMKKLLEHANTGGTAFDVIRHAQLLAKARELQPFGKAHLAKIVGSQGVQDWQLYADILNVDDMAPKGDLSGYVGETGGWSVENLMEANNQNVKTVLENANRVGRKNAEALALMKSLTVQEFQQKVKIYMRLQDKKFNDLQKKLAGEEQSWWGKGFDKLMSYGEFARTAAVYDVLAMSQEVDRLRTFYKGDKYTQADVSWADALVTRGKDTQGVKANTGFEAQNRILNTTFDLVADPINVLHPFRVTSAAIQYGSRVERLVALVGLTGKGTGLGRYGISPAEQIVGTGWVKDFERYAKGQLVYSPGTWSKGEIVKRVSGGTLARWGIQEQLVRRTLKLRDEIMNDARGNASISVRHGFVLKPGIKVIRAIKNKKTQALIEKNRPLIEKWLGDSSEAGWLLDDLKEIYASMYVDKARGEFSQFGAIFFAHQMELQRIGVIHEIATETAWAHYNDHVAERIEGKTIEDLKGMTVLEQVEAVQSADLLARKTLAEESVQEYYRILRDSGSYVGTSAVDSAATTAEARMELGMQISKRVALRRSTLRDTVIPIIQDMLEKHADDAFEKAQKNPEFYPSTVAKQSAAPTVADLKPGVNIGPIPSPETLAKWEEKGVRWVPMDSFDPNAVRLEERGELEYDITNLTADMEKNGLKRPVAMYDGSHRYNAARRLGWTHIPTYPGTKHMLVENGVGFNSLLKPVEKPTGGIAKPVVHPMWNDVDRYKGGLDNSSDRLRRLAAESFDEDNLVDIENPQFDHEWSWSDASELIEQEIATKTGRLQWYASRNFEAGTLDEGFDFYGKVTAIAEETRLAWEKLPNGKWRDTRPSTKVSALYARHRLEAFGAADSSLFPKQAVADGTLTPEEGLRFLAAMPAQAAKTTEQRQQWGLTWAMGTHVKQRLPWEQLDKELADEPVAFASARGFVKSPFVFEKPNVDAAGNPIKVGQPGYQNPNADRTTQEVQRIATGKDAEGRPVREQTGKAFTKDNQYKIQLDAYYDHIAKFQGMLTEHQIAVSHGYDEILPTELFKQGVYMQAFKHAESAPLKTAYRLVEGALDTWRFATLPLRPGWMVRNIIDNTAKILLAGVVDPRFFFLGGEHPGKMVSSVFDMGLVPMRQMISWLDSLFGTNLTSGWLAIESRIWTHSTEVLKNIFAAHGINVPEAVLEGTRHKMYDVSSGKSFHSAPIFSQSQLEKMYDEIAKEKGEDVAVAELDRLGFKWEGFLDKPRFVWKGGEKAGEGRFSSFRDNAWELMGNRPESYSKRVLYRAKFAAAEKRMRQEKQYLLKGAPAKATTRKQVETWRKNEYGDIPSEEVLDEHSLPFVRFLPVFVDKETRKVYQPNWDDYLYHMEHGESVPGGGHGWFRWDAQAKAHGDGIETLEEFDARMTQVNMVAENGKIASANPSDLDFGDTAWVEKIVSDRFNPDSALARDEYHALYPMHEGGLKEVAVDYGFDVNAFRGHIEKVLGKEVSDDITITTKFVDNYPLPGEKQRVSRGSAVWDEETGKPTEIKISIPRNVFVKTQAEAQAYIEQMSKTVAHELQHQVQNLRKTHPVWRRKFEKNEIPYKYRPREIGARIAGTLNKHKYLDLGSFRYDGVLPLTQYDDTAIAIAAHHEAWAEVERVLFDYSQVSVAEDNFRVFFPFIQFWRKNTGFWIGQFAEKPWLDNAILQIDEAREEAHIDEPLWMRRYLSKDEIVDAAAVVPGMDLIAQALIPDSTMYDPLNFFSFAPLFRAYKKAYYGESQLTAPADEEDGGFLLQKITQTMLDTMNDFGLGASPFGRKPLEAMNFASDKGWQTVFPETGPLVAMTAEYFNDEAALTLADWERIWTLWMGDKPSDTIADQYDYHIQQEIAGQALRGEPISAPQAHKIVRHWFLVQNVTAFGSGMYLRRATPEDVALATLQNDLILDKVQPADLTPEEQKAITLWRMRGMERLTYDRYLDLLPLIEAYYKADDWQTKQRLKREHPEMIRWVDATWRGRPFSGKLMQHGLQAVQTQQFRTALDFADGADLPYEMSKAAVNMFVTNDLKKYWQSNNTPVEERERMVSMEAHNMYQKATDAYHEIPDDDYDAKDAFLADHPEVIRYWNRNNNPVDDLDAIWHGANAALRETYFAIKDAKGWDGAASFLKAHPYIFEDTKSAKKIKDGAWIGGGKYHSKPMSAAHRAAWLEAKPHLKWFFDSYMKKVGEKRAWAWLESADGPVAKLLKDYFKNWGKKSGHSLDYLRAKKWLAIFFDLPEDEKYKWLDGNSEGAKIVKWYFAKWGKNGGGGQHARDYLAVKDLMKAYFAMSKNERRAWLNGKSPDALKVLAYFKKYGKAHQQERAFLKKFPGLAHGTPEQAMRLEFWRQYYSLTPDQRPAFVHNKAEDFGVFIYGAFGDKERHDREAEYMRRATGLGLKTRQADYLYVKPLLDFMETLPKKEKPLFMEANPEIQEYFDKYPSKVGDITGNKQTDKHIEAYFKLEAHSNARSQYLKMHPDVQNFFDKSSSPAEKAMHNLLEQYFEIADPNLRAAFNDKHPEIQAYFDKKRITDGLMAAQYNAFNESDPRLASFFHDAGDMARAAEAMRDKLHHHAGRLMDDAMTSHGDRVVEDDRYRTRR